jgi:sulfur-carrier protein
MMWILIAMVKNPIVPIVYGPENLYFVTDFSLACKTLLKLISIFFTTLPFYFMQIKVRLFATLREGRGKEIMMDFEHPARPQDIIQKLNIPLSEVAILLINGFDGDPGQMLKDGDTVSIFPPVGGG